MLMSMTCAPFSTCWRATASASSYCSFRISRAKAFEPEAFEAQLRGMSDAEVAELVDALVDEEVLAREARRRGLAEGDDVIRLRLVQRLSFLLEREPAVAPDEATLAAFLSAHAEAYAEPAVYSFAQVFFDAEQRGAAAALAQARAALPRLRARRSGFNDVTGEGDRFPWATPFVERTRDYVQSQLGEGFVAALDALPRDEWQGPVVSGIGAHLVLLTERRAPRTPPLAEIRDRVADDWRREQGRVARDAAVRELRAKYDVRVRLGQGAP
jgi:hypothetical protein